MVGWMAVPLFLLCHTNHIEAFNAFSVSRSASAFCGGLLVPDLACEELGHGLLNLISLRRVVNDRRHRSSFLEGTSMSGVVPSHRQRTAKDCAARSILNRNAPGEQRRSRLLPNFGVRSAMWLVSAVHNRLQGLERGLHWHALACGNASPELQEAQAVTAMGLLKNIVLTLGKGVIGFTANSQALVADAMHSLTDIMADLVAMATLRIARLPADREHPYGHGKYEPIGALCISSLLVSAGISLAWTSVGIVQDMLSSNVALAVPGIAALWLSLVAIALNEALFRITIRAGEQAKSQTVIANAWHHRSDALSSVVAMVGISLAMVGFPILDPIAGGCVGLMIARTGGEMIINSINDLIDTSDEQVISSVKTIISKIPDVVACKSVRHRRMGPCNVVDAQLIVNQHLSLSAAEHVVATARFAVQKQMPEITEVMLRASPSGFRANAEMALEDLVSHQKIQEQVRKLVKQVSKQLGSMCVCKEVQVHYIRGQAHVTCTIVVADKMLGMEKANQMAVCLRSTILSKLPYLSHAEILLKLDAQPETGVSMRKRNLARESVLQ